MHVIILGCGRVGSAAAERLRTAGHRVTGVRRDAAALADADLEAVAADVTEPDDLATVPSGDAVVYAASAGSRDLQAARATYVEGLRAAVEHFGARADPPDRFCYTGSTGVYGDHGGVWVDEETPIEPETEREAVLAEAERIVREVAPALGMAGTVLRFAGLYGPGRYRLDRYLEGPVLEGYLNMVHEADAAGALAHVLDGDHARDGELCVVDDEPAWRPAFAAWLAEECGVEAPAVESVAERVERRWDDESTAARLAASKRVSNDRLRATGYDLAYPTYREGYRPAVEAFRERDG